MFITLCMHTWHFTWTTWFKWMLNVFIIIYYYPLATALKREASVICHRHKWLNRLLSRAKHCQNSSWKTGPVLLNDSEIISPETADLCECFGITWTQPIHISADEWLFSFLIACVCANVGGITLESTHLSVQSQCIAMQTQQINVNTACTVIIAQIQRWKSVSTIEWNTACTVNL